MRALLGLAIALQFSPAPDYIPRWHGSATLHYCIDRSAEPFRGEIIRAFAQWMYFAGLPWGETADCSAKRTVAFRAAAVQERLGYAFWPPPLFPEPAAGDVTLATGIPWRDRAYEPLLYPTILHETGHAIGLPESYNPLDVMSPLIAPSHTFPTEREIRHVRCLYG